MASVLEDLPEDLLGDVRASVCALAGPALWAQLGCMCVSWRKAVVRGVTGISFRSGVHRDVVLAAVALRPKLRHIDLRGCTKALDSDEAFAEVAGKISATGARVSAIYLAGVPLGWSSRATLRSLGVTGWAFPAHTIERGCVLISRPCVQFQGAQPFFDRAVILVVSHDTSGTAGLIANKPTGLSLGELSSSGAWSPDFDDSVLHLGGDVGQKIHLLHGHEEIGGLEVCDGIFLGTHADDVARAVDAVRSGACTVKSFRWSLRTCSWRTGQLASELQRGIWWLAHIDPAFLLPSDNPHNMWYDLRVLIGHGTSDNTGSLQSGRGA
eukprot:gnl/TRDRNA2_/TRDRNA2_28591_c0_seq1.p1 gnl/TRDRNA2_/TRDRNA2_28591_c0~~gnl/TRDRNA2_/TRDRNA2_28591_c0_seq1.p1  ORF type:complete len:325 (+),score=24.56 gnl/TRDRNA2_/TRDRNA2_28591_c0_seq1:41-1015(+)